MKRLPGEARELCRCLGTCPRCHPRCWRSSASVSLGAQILLGKAPSFSLHVPCQAELAAEEPALEMFLRISLSKLGPTCCVAVFPFLVTKCFFLAALSTVPLFAFSAAQYCLSHRHLHAESLISARDVIANFIFHMPVWL